MVEYIKQLIAKIKRENAYSHSYLAALHRELGRVDPRDFEPQVQHEFVWERVKLKNLADANRTAPGTVTAMLDTLSGILDKHRGERSRGATRSFAYLADANLRKIIERDYFDLTVKLFPGGAWKSTVIMAGSLLEAILFDVLSNPKRVAQTNAARKGAKARGGVPIDITVDPDSWKLIHLIEVAVEIGVLPADRAVTIDQVLRDYRNFVHPQKEIRASHACTEAEAGLAKYGLDGVCDHLEKTL
jgi:hypothetical protein